MEETLADNALPNFRRFTISAQNDGIQPFTYSLIISVSTFSDFNGFMLVAWVW